MVWIFGKWKGGCRGKAHKKEGEGCVWGGGGVGWLTKIRKLRLQTQKADPNTAR